jgi:hypothetical protein
MDNEKNLDAAFAGNSLSSWLPIGFARKIIFLLLLIATFLGLFLEPQWYQLVLLLIAAIMSPRVVGEVAYFIGKLLAVVKK